MALFRRNQYKQYFKYTKGMTEAKQEKKILSYAQWFKAGKPEGIVTVRTKAIQRGLSEAGISNISADRKAREAARRRR